jgi:hypothetical protein
LSTPNAPFGGGAAGQLNGEPPAPLLASDLDHAHEPEDDQNDHDHANDSDTTSSHLDLQFSDQLVLLGSRLSLADSTLDATVGHQPHHDHA